MINLYVGCLTFGIMYSILYSILGSHGVEHDAHIHVDGSHDAGPSFLNPLVIASALTAFGGAGIIGQNALGFSTIITLLFSLVVSFFIGALVFYGIVRLLYNSQANSNFSMEDLYDIEAEVMTPIPQKGFGEILFTAGGTRNTLPAQSLDGTEIPKGTKVMIRKIENRIAYVGKKVELDVLILEEEKLRKRRKEE